MSEIDDLKEFSKKTAQVEQILHTSECIASRDQTEPVVVNSKNLLSDARMWAVLGDAFVACEKAVGTLPAGHYIIEASMDKGIFFRSVPINTDNLIRLPDSASDDVIREIDEFWSLENHFRKYGFLWKRGILLWGSAGSGKSSTLQLVGSQMVNNGHIVIYVTDPSLAVVGLKLLRRIEPQRHLMLVLEDIDAIVNRHGEASLLSLLDGEHQIDNVVYVATTNYPERLDKRLVNRPSRFDLVRKIGMPNRQARDVYLSAKSKILQEDDSLREIWVDSTEGFSIAHLKELIISVEVFKRDFETSIARLKAMMDCDLSSSDEDRKPMGFKTNQVGIEYKVYAAKSL